MFDLYRYSDRLKGSTMACIGYMLSPLSWWNDLYVNIPIAYACAWLISLFARNAFTFSFAGAYLATNVLGFVLLHKGIIRTLSKQGEEKPRYTRKQILKDVAISVSYTALMVLLVKLNIIRPVQEYLK